MMLAIVGGCGGTNIGDSLKRAAGVLGLPADLIDHACAYAPGSLVQRVLWKADRRPLRMSGFARKVRARAFNNEVSILIATGIAPLHRSTLKALRERGIRCINFSTDDPWNPAHRGRWFLEALPLYHTVFTSRRSNIADFTRAGCTDVRYLPFGYDDELFPPPRHVKDLENSGEVLFVGGADDDRAAFMQAFRASGALLTLAGSYWDRYGDLAPLSRGQLSPPDLAVATRTAAVNLCLVRRANRDGHVMRSFEIPAVGGFMLAEDTPEHRAIFGDEGKCVLFFASPDEAARKALWMMEHPEERLRLAAACHAHIAGGANTYVDRLRTMLDGLV